MNELRYKGYEGTAEMDFESGVCHGRIRFIDDLVTYEAPNPKQLRMEFEAAVDDYLTTCSQLGREPKKPASGIFNVRTTPEKHAALVVEAKRHGKTLNAVVNDAFDVYLGSTVAGLVPPSKLARYVGEWTAAAATKVQIFQQLRSNKEPHLASYAPAEAPGLDMFVAVTSQTTH